MSTARIVKTSLTQVLFRLRLRGFIRPRFSLCRVLLISILLLGQHSFVLAQSSQNPRYEEVKQFNTDLAVPGGVALLEISKVNNKFPLIRYGTKEVALLETENAWIAIIGIDLQTIPGYYVAYIKHDDGEVSAITRSFAVGQKHYPIMESAGESDRISEELSSYEELSILDFINTSPPSLPLQWPVTGDWNSQYGRVSLSEGASTQNFIGLTQTSQGVVVAPQNALVAKIEPFNRAGLDESAKRIFLDHGRGIFSVISGVSDLTVEVGNGILAGAVIGRISAQSGTEAMQSVNQAGSKLNSPLQVELSRSESNKSQGIDAVSQSDSSPLLYWQVIINNVFVDPSLLTLAKILNPKG